MGRYSSLLALTYMHTRAPANQRSACRGWGFHSMRSGVDPRDLGLGPRDTRVVHVRKDTDPGLGVYPPRVWRFFPPLVRLILPGWCWVYELQQISDQQTGLGFPQHARRYQPRAVSVYISQVSGFEMYRRIVLPGIKPNHPRVALTLCRTSSQSAINRWGWGFHTVRSGVVRWDIRFHPRNIRAVDAKMSVDGTLDF